MRVNASPLCRGPVVGQVLAQEIAHTEPSERPAVAVAEQRRRSQVLAIRGLSPNEISKQPRCPRPQRTETNLVALAVQAHLLGWVEPQIPDLQIKHLLNAGSGVEHQCKESEITLPGRRAPIDVAH